MKRLRILILSLVLLFSGCTSALAISTLDATKPTANTSLSQYGTYLRETRSKVNEVIGDIPTLSDYTYVTGAASPLSGDKLLVDTAALPATITLPASPATGAFIHLVDAKDTWDTNNVTLARNGEKINGVAADYTLSNPSAYLLTYTGSAFGWSVHLDSFSPLISPSLIDRSVAWTFSNDVTISGYLNLANPEIDYIRHYSDSLNLAATTIGTTPKTLLINRPVTLTGNLTVQDTLQLWVVEGGSIDLNGYTLNINKIKAEPINIFTNASTLHFFSGAAPVYYPEWTGADATATTGNSLAIQYLLDAVPAGSEILFTKTYTLDKRVVSGVNLAFRVEDNGITLRFAGDAGFIVGANFIPAASNAAIWLGDGTGHTDIKWLGGKINGNKANQTASTYTFGLRVDTVANFLVDGLHVHDTSGAGIDVEGESYGTLTHLLVEDCGIVADAVGHGIQMLCDWANTDNFTILEDSTIRRSAGAALIVDIFGTNEGFTKQSITRNCLFEDNALGNVAVSDQLSQVKITHSIFAILENCLFRLTDPATTAQAHLRVGNTYLADSVVYNEYVQVKNCKFIGDPTGYAIWNIGPSDRLDVTGCEFRGATTQCDFYIFSRSPGNIDGNFFYGAPSFNHVVIEHSNTSVSRNVFHTNIQCIKVQSKAAFTSGAENYAEVDVDDCIIESNRFQLTANAANPAISLVAEADSYIRNIRVSGNVLYRGSYTIPAFVALNAGGITAGGLTNLKYIQIADNVGGLTSPPAVQVTGASGSTYLEDISVTNKLPSDVITLEVNSATPSVLAGEFFLTANTNPTVITNLLHLHPGKRMSIRIGDANTGIDFTTSGLVGNGGVDYVAAAGNVGDVFFCSCDNASFVSCVKVDKAP